MNSGLQKPDIDYAQATRRLFWLTGLVGFVGSLVALVMWGGPSGLGFAIGSAASLANLWMWYAITLRLSGDSGRRSNLGSVFFAGKFLALFALGYVILKTLNIEPLAAILGLFSSVLAVIGEIAIELVIGSRQPPEIKG
ncbi:MAG TPA: ATP synthase subunit I [Bryobacteraceae bacterium]|nr:ATP synthase subunit I [Bryobacteraceae bacterium]